MTTALSCIDPASWDRGWVGIPGGLLKGTLLIRRDALAHVAGRLCGTKPLLHVSVSSKSDADDTLTMLTQPSTLCGILHQNYTLLSCTRLYG